MAAGDTAPLREPLSPWDDKVRGILAFVLVGGLFAFVGATFIWPPKLPGDTVGVVIGYIAGWVSAAVSFYWGTSSPSNKASP